MPIKKSVTPQDVVDLLNEIIKLDPDAINTLCNSRVSCNKALADHPTIQVMASVIKDTHYVGLIGVLNGIFGTYDNSFGCIAMDGQKIGSKFIASGFKLVDSSGEELK